MTHLTNSIRITIVLALFINSLLFASPAHASTVFTVWMSSSGSDANDGSQAAPVLSLARVQDIVRSAAPDVNVEIRVDQGVYVAGQTTWDYYIPGKTITFMPADFEVGDTINDFAGRPVFRSNGSTGYWLTAKIPVTYQGPDLVAGLRFYYLQVELYGQGGLMLYGRTTVVDGFRVPTTRLTGNKVWGMKFEKIGSKWGNGVGYGGLSLSTSSGNDIGNNHFRYLENLAPSAGGIHGIYALHGSDSNVVRSNSFYVISGHPMRTRNQSNGNDVHSNKFTLTGGAAYSEWFCDQACVNANPGSVLECASHSNVLHDNDLVSGYGGGTLIEYWLSPSGLTNPGPTGCPALPTQRITTYGNF